MKKFLFLAAFIPIFFGNVLAQAIHFPALRADDEMRYVVRLKNGDILTGIIVEMFSEEKEGAGMKLKTAIGTARIYESQIAEIRFYTEQYRHNHRIFLQPTAEKIGKNYFIGNVELMLLYVGAGYGPISVTAGRTIIPGISASEQGSLVNLKATLYDEPDSLTQAGISAAVGANWAFLNARNSITHLYGVATFAGERSRINATVFCKTGRDDFNTIRVGTLGAMMMNYANGAFGIGIGSDTKLTEHHDVHIIAELWNNDVAKPTNTAILLGVRLANTNVAADFGLAFSSEPFFAPFASFMWTPF